VEAETAGLDTLIVPFLMSLVAVEGKLVVKPVFVAIEVVVPD
jgi:hypothetical protein